MRVAAILFSALLLSIRSVLVQSVTYGKISALRLVHAKSGAFISTLVNGTVVYLNNTNPSMTIMAVPDRRNNGSIKRVQMKWDKLRWPRLDGIEPYTLCGAKFRRCRRLGVGTHTVSTRVVGSGDGPHSVHFQIVAGFSPPQSPTTTSAAPIPTTKSPTAPQPINNPPTATDSTSAPLAKAPVANSPIAALAPMMVPQSSPKSAPIVVPPGAAPMAPVVNTTAPATRPVAATTKAPVTTLPPRPTAISTKMPSKEAAAPVSAPNPATMQAPLRAPVVAPQAPTRMPVQSTTSSPTKPPTKMPAQAPTKSPTRRPTNKPTRRPTKAPTRRPTKAPVAPTKAPSTSVKLPGAWIEEDTPIIPRYQSCFVMVNNVAVGRRAYLVGGLGTNLVTEVYNPFNRTWSMAAKPPVALSHMQCVAAQGQLWIVAAWVDNEKNAENIYVYDPPSNNWLKKTALPFYRRRGSAAVAVSADETKIYVSHGSSGGHEWNQNQNVSQAVPYLDVYFIETDTWTELSSAAPNVRDHAGAAIVGEGGKYLCVAGGRRGDLYGFPIVEPTDCFNFETGEWEVKSPISPARSRSLYTATCDGKLMVIGGAFGATTYNNVNIFDGTTWTTLENLPIGRHSAGLAVDCACNQIHVVAGMTTAFGSANVKSMVTYYPGGAKTVCSV